MDQQKIVHLAGEVVVIGGVFLYLNKQIKNLRKELEDVQEVMIKQQEFIEKNFEGISKSIDFIMRNKQPQPMRKQKINITPIPMDSVEDDMMENEIINNAQSVFKTVENLIPTLEIIKQEIRKPDPVVIQNIDDISDVNEELSMLENENIQSVAEPEEPKKEEEPITIEVKQPELVVSKDKKKKPKAK